MNFILQIKHLLYTRHILIIVFSTIHSCIKQLECREFIMSLSLNSIKNTMKQATSYKISQKAIYLMTIRSEQWVIENIKKAAELLEERNELSEKQGIPTKSMISYELLMEVLNNDD